MPHPETQPGTQPDIHPDHAVPHHAVAAYARDGVVLVQGLLDADEVALVIPSLPPAASRWSPARTGGPGSCPGPS
jgi:hypothetical protein